MTRATVIALTLGLTATACGSPGPELGVVRVRSGVWEDEEILEYHLRTIYSQCVLDGLAEFTPEELDAWRQAFCDRDVHPSAVNCASMEVQSADEFYAFQYFEPVDRTEDTDYILGPIPTPESMDCDPYIELAGIYFATPTSMSATGARPGAVFPKARADGKRY